MPDPDQPDEQRGALPAHLDSRGRSHLAVPEAGAPEESGPARRPGALRMLRRTGAGLSMVLLVVSVAGWFAYDKYDGQLNRIAGLQTAVPGTATPPAAPEGARNVLMVGSDSRADVGASFGHEKG